MAALSFNRSKLITVEQQNASLLVQGILEDYVHSIRVTIEFAVPSLTIRQVAGEMLRVPYEECRLALPNLQSAVGLRVERGLTARVDALVGRRGCVHLANLALECAHATIHGLMAAELASVADQVALPMQEIDQRLVEAIPLLQEGCMAFGYSGVDTTP